MVSQPSITRQRLDCCSRRGRHLQDGEAAGVHPEGDRGRSQEPATRRLGLWQVWQHELRQEGYLQ